MESLSEEAKDLNGLIPFDVERAKVKAGIRADSVSALTSKSSLIGFRIPSASKFVRLFLPVRCTGSAVVPFRGQQRL